MSRDPDRGADWIDGDTTVDGVLIRDPRTAAVFVRRRMQCVGCEMARFETIANVCSVYTQPLAEVLSELRGVAARHA